MNNVVRKYEKIMINNILSSEIKIYHQKNKDFQDSYQEIIKALRHIKKNLIKNKMFIKVDWLFSINNAITRKNTLWDFILFEYNKTNMNNEIIEDNLYNKIDKFNEEKLSDGNFDA